MRVHLTAKAALPADVHHINQEPCIPCNLIKGWNRLYYVLRHQISRSQRLQCIMKSKQMILFGYLFTLSSLFFPNCLCINVCMNTS